MTRYVIFFLLIFLSVSQGFSQSVFRINSLPAEGIVLDKEWKFHTGDNPDWANPAFNDSQWDPINPTEDIKTNASLWKAERGWYRLHFSVDSTLAKQSLAALVQQTGASEIFLNGRLIGKFGEISVKEGKVYAATPINSTFVGLPLSTSGEQVLAIRFAIQKGLPYIVFAGRPNTALSLRLIETKRISAYLQEDISPYFDFLRTGLYFIFFIIHFALYWFNSSQKSNLYFFLYALLNTLVCILVGLVYQQVNFAETRMDFLIVLILFYLIGQVFLLTALYLIVNQRRGFLYWLLVLYALASFIVLFTDYTNGYNIGVNFFGVLSTLECVRITALAARKKQRGAQVITGGSIAFLVFYTLSFLSNYLPSRPNWIFWHFAYNLSELSIPVSISIYLALEASFISRSLTEKLEEVRSLSTEKQQLLATQNETLERQVHERTAELNLSLETLKTTQNQLIQKEKMASLGELTAGIAHEIQNPLNFVNNFSEVSADLVSELEEEQQRPERDLELEAELLGDLKLNLQKITHHGSRASSIVKGMLEHSHSSNATLESTNLNALTDEYLRLAYHGWRAKDKSFNCELLTEFDPSIKEISMMPQEIGRVLLNLYTNAFYAVRERQKQGDANYQPKLSVYTIKTQIGVEVRITDNGIGIPNNVIQKIFQPFFTTKPTGEGTGLGLSLSYDIISKGHNGSLLVESQPGKGTEFIIKLPV